MSVYSPFGCFQGQSECNYNSIWLEGREVEWPCRSYRFGFVCFLSSSGEFSLQMQIFSVYRTRFCYFLNKIWRSKISLQRRLFSPFSRVRDFNSPHQVITPMKRIMLGLLHHQKTFVSPLAIHLLLFIYSILHDKRWRHSPVYITIAKAHPTSDV